MAITEEEIEQAKAKIEQGDLRGAAQIIIAKPDADEEHLDLVEETLRTIQSPTISKVQNIYDVYQRDQNNLAKLKNALANVQDIVNPLVHGQKQEVKNHIVKKSQNKVESTKREVGAENWFVLPDNTALERIEDVIVVVGSPVTDVLRERYMKQYKMASIQHFTKEQLKALEAEEYQDAERELSRQTEFVEMYKDSARILDRDIFVHQISMKFNGKQYSRVPQEKLKEEKNTKIYYFISGQITIKYDLEKKLHSVNISGTIPGRIAISIKRRTTSGRIIDDSYAILEIHDGAAVFYAFSSKGIETLSGLDQIRRTMARAQFDLSLKEPAKIGSKSDVVKLVSNINVKTTDTQSTAPDTQTSPLREQLKSYIASGASKSTIKYVTQQISTEEGKSVDEINAEFNLSSKPTKKQQKGGPDLTGTEFLKDRVEDLKKSISKNQMDSQEKKDEGS